MPESWQTRWWMLNRQAYGSSVLALYLSQAHTSAELRKLMPDTVVHAVLNKDCLSCKRPTHQRIRLLVSSVPVRNKSSCMRDGSRPLHSLSERQPTHPVSTAGHSLDALSAIRKRVDSRSQSRNRRQHLLELNGHNQLAIDQNTGRDNLAFSGLLPLASSLRSLMP